MYRISEIASRAGLSRTTLLYYEKLGLIAGQRAANGYRVYTDADVQRLFLLQQLQAGGLSLKECQACLDGKIDRSLLQRRLETLDAEIQAKQCSRELLSGLLGQNSLKTWHEELERIAPELHRAWLVTQGFSDGEAARVALLSKDMNAHDRYMADFFKIFSGLDYWGPGTPEATAQALAALPSKPKRILEIGCGNGVATVVLAAKSDAHITAIDTEQRALDRLIRRAATAGQSHRIEALHLDMGKVPTPETPYDVIWAEGSAYIIGVERALSEWKRLLRKDGVLVFSDMVWRTQTPSESVASFWASEYPAMAMVSVRLGQAARAGYRVLSHFDMGQSALDTYFGPLENRVRQLADEIEEPRVLSDLHNEIGAYHACEGQFGYEMFVLQRC